jgi:peptide/nickel transport system substrate-binding protein
MTFCSGKKFTAADVVYSFKRLVSPEPAGAARLARRHPQGYPRHRPLHGRVQLAEPFSDLLLNLTMFTTAIHNKESVEALGKDYGAKAIDGTGVVLRVLAAAHRDRAQAPRRLQMGPAMYQNKGR